MAHLGPLRQSAHCEQYPQVSQIHVNDQEVPAYLFSTLVVVNFSHSTWFLIPPVDDSIRQGPIRNTENTLQISNRRTMEIWLHRWWKSQEAIQGWVKKPGD